MIKIEFEKRHIAFEETPENSAHGVCTAYPLERGYGTTLGNALRRVLLSSLPGTAVTGMRIEGAPYEYVTAPGVRESAMEIGLNLRGLVARLHGEETKKALRIDVTAGEEAVEVTAEDIIADEDVEICNPELYIASVEAGASLKMEITLETGTGYVEAGKAEGGYIPVDAFFTPVRKANYTVENNRVGKRTDYDKLTLEVETDGSLSAGEAVSEAAERLFQHFSLFQELSKVGEDIVIDDGAENEPGKRDLSTPIEELDLSVRSYNCLKRANIDTIRDLVRRTEDEMIRVRNLGRKSLDEIINKLAERNLSLARPED